ncbi:unnamed protein product [Lactuca virosa]|uniref:Uncharacterized protein n=1 Tax=Lactuca virosa TaxID=75947 RepID=A0AAU9LSR8_9ASTR|nr:unnamed protein product [Lactuca virosa]
MSKDIALDPYECCLFRKQRIISINSTRKNHFKLLSHVHFDVCGPIEVESLGGSRYSVTYIDDASRKLNTRTSSGIYSLEVLPEELIKSS